MKKSVLAIVTGLGALAAASAFANHHEGKKEGEHNWEAKLSEKFSKVDANNDGNISSEEYMAYKQAEAEKEWAKWATAAGDDGMVSLEEAKAHHMAMMKEHKEKMKHKMHDNKMED